MIRAPTIEQAVIRLPWGLLEVFPTDSHHPCRQNGTADRFCAWAGRSGRRYIFSVLTLDAAASETAVRLPSKAIVLLVRRPAAGRRRVLWAERIETEGEMAAVVEAATEQAGAAENEIHLHVGTVEEQARRAAFADLAFPAPGAVGVPIGLLRLAG